MIWYSDKSDSRKFTPTSLSLLESYDCSLDRFVRQGFCRARPSRGQTCRFGGLNVVRLRDGLVSGCCEGCIGQAKHPSRWERSATLCTGSNILQFAEPSRFVALATGQSPADLRLAFDQFLERYTGSPRKKTLSTRERETLFAQFMQFLQSQGTGQSAR
jgi:hypothetical protein